MKPNTQKLYEFTVQAKDLFDETDVNINITVGLMDQILRKKGLDADAVTVDAIVSKNRLIFVLLDNDSSTVGVGLGNIVEDNINLVNQIPLNLLSAKSISDLIIQYLK